MYNWSSIKKIRWIAYTILAINLGLGLFLISGKAKNIIYHKYVDGRVGYIHAKRGVKLRQEPRADSNPISNIGNGESVTILNDTSTVNEGWVQIKYRRSTGWVWGDYLSK
ncbi:SH3 domain-containing protein [Mucilaginibacter sabulilitoris]|uniref:SH3 domain-containing protein n=1 Tax=Mucilaginibacter sabulilitoris TaxID=1173583 RepID=A0ABZ0TMC2_9SPHI|nr:SH3 domain-containing protein [Mucilaginibacter sabulilitoris]WPU94316.1 SH3 domain-containing protein [Mucilaginibacter sabulilitoris]